MREWIITNGIGGYASSTDFGGMNTRKYHGLLIASMNPPYNRNLILSKLDESIEINGKKTILYTNKANGEITDGYKRQIGFEKDIIPVFTYKVSKVVIEKSICMIHGKNAVAIIYRIMNQKAKTKFNLTPIVNFKDFHSETQETKFKTNQIISKDEDAVQIDFGQGKLINMGIKGAKYEMHKNDIFYHMEYDIEKQRGFNYKENHLVPGTFTVELKPNEDKEIVFVCATGDKFGISFDDITKLSGEKIIKSEVKRIEDQIEKSDLLDNMPGKLEDRKNYKDLIEKYIVASDNFIVYKASNKLHTVIAGYPWFTDWSRDTLIAFEGLVLIPGKYKIAEDILMTCINKMKSGLVPNGFSEYNGKPMYNSVDASLLFFEAVNKYLKYTSNYDFIKNNLYKKMKAIIDNYIDGIKLDGNNIYLDEIDYLIVSGTPKTQNTWMDAKVNDIAVTPRNGKAVEINAMWYNALRVMQDINKHWNKKISQIEYSYIANRVKKSFEKKFYNPDKKSLYDVLGDDKIRPNQLFALSLSYPVLDCTKSVAKEILITVTQRLLNKYGLMTLAKEENGFIPKYEGGPIQRDSSYHQGTTWVYLLGQYYNALKNLIDAEENDTKKKMLKDTLAQFKLNIANNFTNELVNGNTCGSICEIYDAINPKQGKGAFAQAWSVAEVFRILLDKI